jgi:hypothetical protein
VREVGVKSTKPTPYTIFVGKSFLFADVAGAADVAGEDARA